MAMSTKTVFIKQVTAEGRSLGPYEGFYACGEAQFNRTGLTCYFQEKSLRRFSRGHWTNEATHECLEDGEAYLVREVEHCDVDHRKTFVGKFLKKSRKVEL
jgi:hypothetical protein